MPVENKAEKLLIVVPSHDLNYIIGYAGGVNGSFEAKCAVEPNKQYEKGELKCAFVSYNEDTEENEIISNFVDVPAFKTKPLS